MCEQCATFAQNKRDNAWSHEHLHDIVEVRVPPKLHAISYPSVTNQIEAPKVRILVAFSSIELFFIFKYVSVIKQATFLR